MTRTKVAHKSSPEPVASTLIPLYSEPSSCKTAPVAQHEPVAEAKPHVAVTESMAIPCSSEGLAAMGGDLKIKEAIKEAVDVCVTLVNLLNMSNATSHGDDLHIKLLNPFVHPLVNLLDRPDVRIVSPALESIENILMCEQRNQHVDGTNPFVAAVEM